MIMLFYLLIDRVFDIFLSIRTSYVISSSSESCFGFSPRSISGAYGTQSAYYVNILTGIRSALDCSGYSPEKTSFVDVGCGTGRPLFVAMNFNFDYYIGCDLSFQALKYARENLNSLRFNKNRKAKVSFIHADAISCLPALINNSSNNFVLYMFNPFTPELMHGFLNSLAATNKRICIIIVNFYLLREPPYYFSRYRFCGLKQRTIVGIQNEN